MRCSSFGSGARRWWLIALCVGGAALSTASYADSDGKRGGHDRKFRGQHVEWSHGRHDARHDGRRDHRRNDRHRDHDRHEVRHGGRHDDDHRRREYRSERRHHDYRRDWHFYNGRYWAPPRYRGRHCEDRRHHHGVHYHVAVRDYYDHYYPRYRSYGPQPHGANASVIITVPLF